MKVLVTGGSGHVGAATVRDLVAHGHQVISVDQRRPPAEALPEGVRFILTDLGNIGEVADAMMGCDAVVHLGAIPAPYSHSDDVVFSNNTRATFAVFQAARLNRIKKVAFASSISALGTAWALEPFPPVYAPVDEAHPLIVKDAYALSKEVDERTGEMFHRRDGMQVIALRFHWVATLEQARAQNKRVDADPNVGDLWKILWGYIELEDAAAICRRAIEVDGLGFEPFIVTARDTLSTIPTEELIRKYAPQTEIRRPLAGCESAFTTEKAMRLLGWEPKNSWRS